MGEAKFHASNGGESLESFPKRHHANPPSASAGNEEDEE
jgi:hypothetical protein